MKSGAANVAILYDKPLQIGGVETHLRSIFRCTDSERFRFTIIAPAAPAFSDLIETGKIQFIPFDRWWPLTPQSYRAFVKTIAEQRIELLHAHSSTAAIIGRIAARNLHLPAVNTVHLPVTEYHGTRKTVRAKTGRRLFIEIDRLLNNYATDQLVYVSHFDRDRCVRSKLAPAGKSIVIPNGIDLSPYRTPKDKVQLRYSMGLAKDSKIITFVGRLDSQKGIEYLLEAFVGLESYSRLLLWIIGEGPPRSDLETLVQRLGIQAQVFFWGYQSPIADFLSASDIFVLPSLYEAMPIALLEALAAGLPCVVTDVGDNRLVIEPEINGLVVSPKDVNDLRQAIERLVDDDVLCSQMKANNKLKAQNYSEHLMVEQLQEIYYQLVDEK